MKNVLFSLCLLIAATGFSQFTFQKRLAIQNQNFMLRSVCELSNGNILVASGYSDSSFSSPTISLSEVDASGNPVSESSFSITGYDFSLVYITQSPDGYIDLVAGCGVYANTKFIVARLIYGGQVLWTREISGQSGFGLYTSPMIKYYSNNDLAVSLSMFESMGLARISPSGNLIWLNRYTSDTTEPKNPSFALVTTSDGGALLTGKADNEKFIVKTDANGVVQWTKEYSLGFNYYCQPRAALEQPDGTFLFSGLLDDMTLGTGAFLMKTDASGNILWHKFYSNPAWTVPPVSHMERLPDGKIVMVSNAVFGMYPVVLIADQSGNILSAKEVNITGAMFTDGTSVRMTSGGDIVLGITGTDANGIFNHLYRSAGSSFLWCGMTDIAVVTSSNSINPTMGSPIAIFSAPLNYNIISTTAITPGGFSTANTCSSTGVTETNNEAMRIYPNPASNHLTIDLSGISFNGGIVSLLDLVGNEVMIFIPTTAEANLDVTKLAKGVYFVKVTSSNSNYLKKVVIN